MSMIPLIVKIRSWFYPIEDYYQDYYTYSTTRNDSNGEIKKAVLTWYKADLGSEFVNEEYEKGNRFLCTWRYLGYDYWKCTRKTRYYEKESTQTKDNTLNSTRHSG